MNKREELRAKRKEAEQEAARKKSRQENVLRAGALFGFLLVVCGLLFALIQMNQSEDTSGKEAEELLRGIPQRGTVLGDPSAPTLVEYADLNCPFCAEFSAGTLEEFIDGPVRSGRAALEFKHWTVTGDSVAPARAMLAASQQNRAWHFIKNYYASQRTSDAGELREIALQSGVPDMDRWERDFLDPRWDKVLLEVEEEAIGFQFSGTPALAIRRGKKLEPTDLNATSSLEEIRQALAS